ncbi:MAG: hypothetical protein QOG63_582 [Thermoleophilaceae bacterium]|nr:hypothetical protein [Thermoleophilaceae bacterium]
MAASAFPVGKQFFLVQTRPLLDKPKRARWQGSGQHLPVDRD